MYILAIDTSCDDTSVAISKDDCILSNIVSSQIDLHKKWGGVVPSIARRAHEENIDRCITEALKRARVKIEQIDIFAVTQGPGLAIALEIGIRKVKELATKYKKPIIAVNHMEGHIMANFAKNSNSSPYSRFSPLSLLTPFPLLALLISGGHTELVLMQKPGHYQILGQTLDDAIGEAYDKVAKMLNLGYPGGPIIEELAKTGNREKYLLPIPMEKNPGLDFSYSGLKTSVLYLLKKINNDYLNRGRAKNNHLTKTQIIDIAASFEKAATEHLCQRLKRVLKIYQVNGILLGGGVCCNQYIRSRLRTVARKFNVPLFWPRTKKLCNDNAAMIAVAAYHRSKNDQLIKDLDDLDRNPIMSL
ncbi:MAG: putative tRNA threonylcarbamoyladenosine biosynthesis protein Gcp [Berkelbacteria bacterium GW2011_GWA2_38_9]|uniref:tRNA N6-adenosine threonylcarbamoyltransferase n=1 Tax=Berkelbacteria bacterium GW2011_GWA2_38_9 TaxID=1618334 RepID=A0A0G0LH08_9BACT|nr:MAG: putative tRNA threonylcarbamoyladenosine biosynthesis protein Gcp [Berkelbacteria bacterium GW2011_GWA2_38_9]